MSIKICLGCAKRFEGKGHYCEDCIDSVNKNMPLPKNLFPYEYRKKIRVAQELLDKE